MPTSGYDIRDLIEARWKRLGYDRLLPEERDYILLWWLHVETSNGTLHQYFYNSTGDHVEETLSALQVVGAHDAYRVLNKAVAAFGEAGYSANREERIKRLDSIPNQYDVFQRLTDELFEQSEDVISLALDRVGQAYEKYGISKVDFETSSAFRTFSIVLLAILAMLGFLVVFVLLRSD